MQFQFAQSSRKVKATKAAQFSIIQNDRKVTITVLQYKGKLGPAEISFINGVEAALTKTGRYEQAKSDQEFCARLV
jgi:hypothetical protein